MAVPFLDMRLQRLHACNQLMSSTCKSMRWQAAGWMLETLPRCNLRLDTSSFNSAILSSAWQVALEGLQELRSCTLKVDQVARNSVASCGRRWRLTLRLAQDVVGYGTLVAKAHWDLGLYVLQLMARKMLRLNRVVLNSAMAACGAPRWPTAVQLLGRLRRSLRCEVQDFNGCLSVSPWALGLGEQLRQQLQPSAVTLNTQMAAAWHHGMELLKHMRSWHLRASQVTWLALVATQWSQAVAVLDRMCQEEPFPSERPFRSLMARRWRHALLFLRKRLSSFNAAITTCRSRQKWRRSAGFLEEMRRSGLEPNEVTYLAFIGPSVDHLRTDPWAQALRLLAAMSVRRLSGESACNSAMNSCQGHWQMASWLLESIPALHLKRQEISFNTAINASSKGSQWSLALLQLNATYSSTLVTSNATISACEKAASWEAALQLLAVSLSDTVSWSSSISACEKAAQWPWGLHLLGAMGHQPNLISFNASISTCEKGRQWPGSLELLETMRGAGLPMDRISFSAVVSACEKTGEWSNVLEAISSMQLASWSPNRIICNAAVAACEKGPLPYDRMPFTPELFAPCMLSN